MNSSIPGTEPHPAAPSLAAGGRIPRPEAQASGIQLVGRTVWHWGFGVWILKSLGLGREGVGPLKELVVSGLGLVAGVRGAVKLSWRGSFGTVF